MRLAPAEFALGKREADSYCTSIVSKHATCPIGSFATISAVAQYEMLPALSILRYLLKVEY